MKKDRKLLVITTISILIFIYFFFEASRVGLPSYRNDSIIFSVLMIVFYLIRNVMNLNPFAYSLLSLSFISHNLGVFGLYANSPFPFEYDLFTHIFGIFAYSIMFYNYFKKDFTKNLMANLWVIVLIILASLGVGSVIEMVEFSGYLYFGQGEGFLLYGAGDFQPNAGPSADYIDSMYDMFYNLFGALVGVIICGIYHRINK
ncbi:hypothetical protein HYT58_02700 [Candidatus Woesearchaeota archaeon]|nr:hypothetical protein [Candidatus Woesearchaeota archaeon]